MSLKWGNSQHHENPLPAPSSLTRVNVAVWPDGKKHPRNVYAKTREECEQLLAEMILQMKAEIAAEKERLRLEEQAG